MSKRVVAWGVFVGLLLCGIVFVLLFWNGIVLFNNPSLTEYPVRGVDVSRYQGEIDWKVLSSQDISFAFIKATEGSSHVDPCFAFNYEQAQNTDLRIGAYHFFSFESPGESQADNFIARVEETEDMLPPVIDLELYGAYEKSPPDKDSVCQELRSMMVKLESHYEMKPILYVTEKTYSLYIADTFSDYDIWIRNVMTAPSLSDGREWTFWQYTNRKRLEGYEGEEKYIDMNVFYGTIDEFELYGRK